MNSRSKILILESDWDLPVCRLPQHPLTVLQTSAWCFPVDSLYHLPSFPHFLQNHSQKQLCSSVAQISLEGRPWIAMDYLFGFQGSCIKNETKSRLVFEDLSLICVLLVFIWLSLLLRSIYCLSRMPVSNQKRHALGESAKSSYTLSRCHRGQLQWMRTL